MTDYAGETYEVISAATALDGVTPFTPSNVAGAVVDINNPGGTPLIVAGAMSWDAAGTIDIAGTTVTGIWFYRWDTTGLTPGTYPSKVTFTGVDGSIGFEYLNLRLKTPKF